MSWKLEWLAIAARISGLVSAGELLAHTFQANREDPHGVAKNLGDQASDIANELEFFKNRASGAPPKALEAIGTFLDKHRMRMNDPGPIGVEEIRVSIVPLAPHAFIVACRDGSLIAIGDASP